MLLHLVYTLRCLFVSGLASARPLYRRHRVLRCETTAHWTMTWHPTEVILGCAGGGNISRPGWAARTGHEQGSAHS